MSTCLYNLQRKLGADVLPAGWGNGLLLAGALALGGLWMYRFFGSGK